MRRNSRDSGAGAREAGCANGSNVPHVSRPGRPLAPRSRATVIAAVLTAIVALAQAGVMVPGTWLGVSCSVSVTPEDADTGVPPAWPATPRE